MPPDAIPKLPVWKTIAEVFTVTARHSLDLLRFAWPWLLVLIAVSGTLFWAFYPSVNAAAVADTGGPEILSHLSTLASTAIGAAIAVPWHQMILLGDAPSTRWAQLIRPQTAGYLWKSVVLMLAAAIPMWFVAAVQLAIALSLPSSDSAAEKVSQSYFDISAFALVALSIASLVWVLSIARFSLILPATAIGRKDVGIGESWRTTRGNTWRIAVASVLPTVVPFLALLYAVHLIFPSAMGISIGDGTSTRVSYTAFNVATELISMLFGMLFITYLSLTYRHFFGTGSGAPLDQTDAAQAG